MQRRSEAESAARSTLVLALAAVVAASGVAVLASAVLSLADLGRVAAADPGALDPVLGAVAALALGLLLVWWGVGAAACVVVTVRPASRGARRLAGTLPRPARALVAAALGAAVVSGVTGPALAAVSNPAVVTTAVDPAWRAVEGGVAATDPVAVSAPEASAALELAAGAPVDPAWAPQRPTPPPATAAPPGLVVEQPRAATSSDEQVVVRRGDTLWDICARHLPAEATDAEIAAEWPLWYAANRDVIGPDPDHIEPGQRLSAPEPADGGR